MKHIATMRGGLGDLFPKPSGSAGHLAASLSTMKGAVFSRHSYQASKDWLIQTYQQEPVPYRYV